MGKRRHGVCELKVGSYLGMEGRKVPLGDLGWRPTEESTDVLLFDSRLSSHFIFRACVQA